MAYGILSDLKKKGNSDIFHNIKVEDIMLSEVSRTHEEQILLGFTYEIPRGFPGSSLGKESTCSAGDLIPGSGRSSGEGIGFPLQRSWPFLVAEMVNYLPAVQETWVQSLG